MAVGDSTFFRPLLSAPGLNVFGASAERLLDWGAGSSLFVFPMATSCCGIEFMATAAARVDLDRMGSIVRGTPRHCDVMVVAGTITVKMAPRVKKLWEQMPEPKWCIAMGSCAISGDFYREIYSVVQGVDTVVPVDIYVPGCPPNPEALMDALLMLKARILAKKTGGAPEASEPPQAAQERPHVRSVGDPERDPAISEQQTLLAGQPELEVEAKDVPLPIFQPAAQAQSGFFDSLVAEFGGETAKDAPPIIDRSKHLAFARRLLGNGYRQLAFIVGSHWLPGKPIAEECYEVAYGLRACGPKSHVAQWRVRTLVADPIDSLTPLVAGANWAEREQFDLVGVRFAGHPDLRRLMLPEAWEGHPLRRDYAINTRCAPWR